jgi:hypothetical protein
MLHPRSHPCLCVPPILGNQQIRSLIHGLKTRMGRGGQVGFRLTRLAIRLWGQGQVLTHSLDWTGGAGGFFTKGWFRDRIRWAGGTRPVC